VEKKEGEVIESRESSSETLGDFPKVREALRSRTTP